jgi:hypothetical protein
MKKRDIIRDMDGKSCIEGFIEVQEERVLSSEQDLKLFKSV